MKVSVSVLYLYLNLEVHAHVILRIKDIVVHVCFVVLKSFRCNQVLSDWSVQLFVIGQFVPCLIGQTLSLVKYLDFPFL